MALSEALKHETDYISFLDSDDQIYPDTLERQYKYMEKNHHLTLASIALGYLDETNSITKVISHTEKTTLYHFNDPHLFKPIPFGSSIIRAKDIGNCNFNASLNYAEDKDFLIRLLNGKKYTFIPRVTYLVNPYINFSFEKYKLAQLSNSTIYKSINLNKFFIFKMSLIAYLKIIFMYVVLKMERKDLYNNLIGLEPNQEEIYRHNKWLNSKVSTKHELDHVRV